MGVCPVGYSKSQLQTHALHVMSTLALTQPESGPDMPYGNSMSLG